MSAIRELFDAVCDLPPEACEAVLLASSAPPEVIEGVRRLLKADAENATDLVESWGRQRDVALQSALAPGSLMGAWRLLREIGHGGMGRVYLAERADGHYQQQAAVKLIREWRDPELAAHFQRERQLLASLQHPQIARLLDGGQSPLGEPYLVMDYVEGVPLDHWRTQDAPSLEARLALFVSVCHVVQYAHRKRVVHCDLKPSNVLVRADGVPVLLDFGIALALEPFGSGARTGPSDAPGAADEASSPRLTPRYASPEQLRGETPGFASDIYSLGLLLRELTIPAESGGGEVRLKRGIAREIEAIVACACATEPEGRYASAAALAEDVSRIDRHLPLAARAPTWRYVVGKLLRRRWPAFAATALLLVLAGAFGWHLVLTERSARREAMTAQKAVDFLVSVFRVSDVNQNPMPRKETSARELLDSGAERLRTELRDEPAVRARLLEALGHAYRHMGHSNAAAGRLREAADLYESTVVDDLPGASRSLESLTNTMVNGQFPAELVERTAQESLELARRIYPARSQPVANALMVQSLALRRGGHYAAALAAAEASLAINLRGLPGNRLPAAWGNLALIKTSLGDFDGAYADNERAAALSAPDAINQFYRHLTRGGLEDRMGRFDAAIATFHQAIAIEAKFRSESSAMAVWARSMLGRTLSSAGRYAEAKIELDRSYADQSALNQDLDELLPIRAELARNRLYSGDTRAAVDELRAVWQARSDAYGPTDTRSLEAGVNLSHALFESGDADESTREWLDMAWASWESRKQAPAPAALRLRTLMARWELEHGDPTRAATLLAEVEAERERLPIRERLEVTPLQARIALRRGEAERARSLAQDALAAYRALLGDADPATHAARQLLESIDAGVATPVVD